MESDETKKDTEQNHSDSYQYSENNIAVLEKIFGKMYISPGGKDSTEYFTRSLSLKSGQRVLDVACGVGGPAFYMARYST